MNYQRVQIGQSLRLNRRHQVAMQVREVYLSDDIPCQLKTCVFCQLEEDTIELVEGDIIYLIDDEIWDQYIDLIEQSAIKNIIVLQTQHNQFKKKSQQVMNLIENNFSKQCYVYQNEFSTITQGGSALLQLAHWYMGHSKYVKTGYQVKLLTQNYQLYSEAKKLNINVQTIQEYIQNDEPNSDLMDYLGMEIEEEQQDNLYPEYLGVDECVGKIKEGLLFDGRMSMDRNDISLGRIIVRQFSLEIRIVGHHQNRALHGDRVAVQLLPESEWRQDVNTNDKLIVEQDEETRPDDDDTGVMKVEHLQQLFRKIQLNKLIPHGQVVGVLQRTDKQYCGSVVDTLFYPADGRYPTFKLQHPRPQVLQDKKILVQLIGWPASSKYPRCKLKKVLGKAGDMHVEGNVILLEHQVEIRDFSQQVLACLPTTGDKYSIPQEEINKRWDLRDILVCSIDPIGCKDIDDTLHCRMVDGHYEVGVHIADVSHFVKPDTAIDKEAAHRCTTVYLVDRRTDMLPKLLTENLCSLVSKVDRLAFSVIWTMDENAKILAVRYGKSVIRSVASLHYGQAQEMIDDVADQSPLTQSIRGLNMLAKKLKGLRVDAGALTLASNQVKFSFDEETHNPTDVRMYPMYDTNSLVEEFMLLANIAVAEKILQRFPAISILRRHQEPKDKAIKDLQQLMNEMGYQFEYDSSKSLNDSLDQIRRINDPFFNKLVRMMTTRCMNEALYICTADVDYPELFHYGLAAELYTHFTSPIRRYADVLVHRLLAAAIDIESLAASMSNKIRMSRICDKMNMRHRNARFASRASSDYHTYLFFKNQPKQPEQAIISGITQKGVTVMLPRYGLEGFIAATQNDDKLSVTIEGHTHRIFDYVTVEVEVELKNFTKKIHMKYISK